MTRTVPLLAQDRGLTWTGRGITPCPLCHAGPDPRPPVTVSYDHRKWRCRHCRASGGRRELAAACDADRAPSMPDVALKPHPNGPNVGELRVMLQACGYAHADADVVRYLASRGVDPLQAADARAYPTVAEIVARCHERAGVRHPGADQLSGAQRAAVRIDAGAPPWAATSGTSWSRDRRLLVLARDAMARVVGVVAVSLTDGSEDAHPGMICTDDTMGEILQGGRQGRPPASWDGTIRVATGAVEYLRAAQGRRGRHRPAVLGLLAPTIPPDVWARMPPDATYIPDRNPRTTAALRAVGCQGTRDR